MIQIKTLDLTLLTLLIKLTVAKSLAVLLNCRAREQKTKIKYSPCDTLRRSTHGVLFSAVLEEEPETAPSNILNSAEPKPAFTEIRNKSLYFHSAKKKKTQSFPVINDGEVHNYVYLHIFMSTKLLSCIGGTQYITYQLCT